MPSFIEPERHPPPGDEHRIPGVGERGGGLGDQHHSTLKVELELGRMSLLLGEGAPVHSHDGAGDAAHHWPPVEASRTMSWYVAWVDRKGSSMMARICERRSSPTMALSQEVATWK